MTEIRPTCPSRVVLHQISMPEELISTQQLIRQFQKFLGISGDCLPAPLVLVDGEACRLGEIEDEDGNFHLAAVNFPEWFKFGREPESLLSPQEAEEALNIGVEGLFSLKNILRNAINRRFQNEVRHRTLSIPDTRDHLALIIWTPDHVEDPLSPHIWTASRSGKDPFVWNALGAKGEGTALECFRAIISSMEETVKSDF